MSVEIATAIGIFASLVGIYNVWQGIRRNNKKDDKSEASEMTTVIVKLENISADLTEIKLDNKNLKADMQKQSEQIIRIDESLKSAWKIINKMQGE